VRQFVRDLAATERESVDVRAGASGVLVLAAAMATEGDAAATAVDCFAATASGWGVASVVTGLVQVRGRPVRRAG